MWRKQRWDTRWISSYSTCSSTITIKHSMSCVTFNVNKPVCIALCWATAGSVVPCPCCAKGLAPPVERDWTSFFFFARNRKTKAEKLRLLHQDVRGDVYANERLSKNMPHLSKPRSTSRMAMPWPQRSQIIKHPLFLQTSEPLYLSVPLWQQVSVRFTFSSPFLSPFIRNLGMVVACNLKLHSVSRLYYSHISFAPKLDQGELI